MIRKALAKPLLSVQRIQRRWCALMVLAAAPAVVGCYGQFPLTHAVYDLNGDITNDKWVHSIMMWVFFIIPVYWVAGIIDIFVLNLIQFWTGDTVSVQGVDANGNEYALVPSADGQQGTLTVTRNGVAEQAGQFVKLADGNWAVVGPNGQRQGTIANMPDGSIEIRNIDGKKMRTIPAKLVKQARERRQAQPVALAY